MWRATPTGKSPRRWGSRREPVRPGSLRPAADSGKCWRASAPGERDTGRIGMSMDDRELENRLAELREHWRVPQDPPLDAMWQEIEARAFGPGQYRIGWIRTVLPLAAMLL